METTRQQTTTAPVSFKQIDASLKTLTVEQPNAAQPETLTARVEKLAKVYSSIKPLLAAVAALPIIPQTWRIGLTLFAQTIDLVVSAPELVAAGDADFKAGKDL
jgi:hypothetical protein